MRLFFISIWSLLASWLVAAAVWREVPLNPMAAPDLGLALSLWLATVAIYWACSLLFVALLGLVLLAVGGRK